LTYKNNFLTKVIVRIDFLNKLESVNKQIPKDLNNIIKKYFPIVEPSESILKDLRIDKSKVGEIETKKIFDWNFFGKNRKKQLHINWENMFIVFYEYNSFEELLKNFIDISERMFENYNSNFQIKRLGLRYINEIEIPGKNPIYWNRYINSNLLSIFKFTEERKEIAKVLNTLELNFETFLFRFQYGAHNPDYPSVIKRRIFILDYDAYSNMVTELSEIKESLPIFHNKIKEYFEKSITNGFRRKLNERQ
jgi:uncharacterized protein (TIGR04255 family)